jgi:LDH2 family malate/lactate/ureidoglycolate dehydrogenase
MDQISPDRVRLTVDEARDLARSALGKLGYDREEASIVAEHTLDAALCGYEYSGLPKILNLAIQPDLLLPLEEYKREMTEMIERIKMTPRQPGIEEIRIPSERAFRERARQLREGISIDRKIYDALVALPQSPRESA